MPEIPLVLQPESGAFSKIAHGRRREKRLSALLELAQMPRPRPARRCPRDPAVSQAVEGEMKIVDTGDVVVGVARVMRRQSRAADRAAEKVNDGFFSRSNTPGARGRGRPRFSRSSFHENAHGVAAERFGDTTARDMGRITMNPLPHIDPIGTVLMPLLGDPDAGFRSLGWAKPVPVNPANFRNPIVDDAYVAAAGPLSNFLLAARRDRAFHRRGSGFQTRARRSTKTAETRFSSFSFCASILIQINCVLGIFNLLPIPPLDGHWILFRYLPSRWARDARGASGRTAFSFSSCFCGRGSSGWIIGSRGVHRSAGLSVSSASPSPPCDEQRRDRVSTPGDAPARTQKKAPLFRREGLSRGGGVRFQSLELVDTWILALFSRSMTAIDVYDAFLAGLGHRGDAVLVIPTPSRRSCPCSSWPGSGSGVSFTVFLCVDLHAIHVVSSQPGMRVRIPAESDACSLPYVLAVRFSGAEWALRLGRSNGSLPQPATSAPNPSSTTVMKKTLLRSSPIALLGIAMIRWPRSACSRPQGGTCENWVGVSGDHLAAHGAIQQAVYQSAGDAWRRSPVLAHTDAVFSPLVAAGARGSSLTGGSFPGEASRYRRCRVGNAGGGRSPAGAACKMNRGGDGRGWAKCGPGQKPLDFSRVMP